MTLPDTPVLCARRRVLMACAAVLPAALLGGCVVAPVGRGPYSSQPGPEIEVAPPAPYAEVIPVIPGAGYVWINGYWRWQINRHVWIGGRWVLPPRPGHIWVPGHWSRHNRGWRWSDGYWRR